MFGVTGGRTAAGSANDSGGKNTVLNVISKINGRQAKDNGCMYTDETNRIHTSADHRKNNREP